MLNLARHFALDPTVTYLNHGSFGACPHVVLDAQRDLRARLESEPVLFLARQWEGLVDEVRAVLGTFLGASPDDLALVTNATAGVNTVLRSLRFASGDEILVTDQGYNACSNAARFVAERQGLRVVTARVPFPLTDPQQVTAAVLAAATARTRLAILDHVTSPTGLVLPIESLVRALAERGIDTLVDGAHAPGMLPLALDALGAAYYTGNCHKWMCTPKGAAFLHVRKDRQAEVHPLVISHGANSPRTDRGRFRLEFDFTGTQDPTAWLVIPEALRFMGSLLPGGWEGVRAHNRALVLRGRTILCETLGTPAPAPESMIGSLATVPLPSGVTPSPEGITGALFDRHRIEVPAWFWPASPARILRVSAQVYNDESQYTRLAGALTEVLAG